MSFKPSNEKSSGAERTVKALFFMSAVFSVVAVFAIIGYILVASFPAFREIGLFRFLFGTDWLPTSSVLPPSERFGILPMIAGSILATFGALLIGGIGGVMSAVFAAFFCPAKARGLFRQIVNLLAGIPSIIYGFFGMTQIVPLLARINPAGTGEGLLAVSIILGLMILPTVAGLTQTGLEAVPRSYYEGALALGATKAQAIFKVMLPAAKSAATTALGLGVGRAVGETMAVLMIAGNATAFPTGPFVFFRTLTTNIVQEMGYSVGLHTQALIATGSVLLVFILVLNLGLHIARYHKKKEGKGKSRVLAHRDGARGTAAFRYRPAVCLVLQVLSVATAGVVSAALAYLVGFILVKGLPHVTVDLMFGTASNGHLTLAPAFVSTGLVILVALAIALPIGIGAAIYLAEYAKKGSFAVKVIRLFTDTLSGIPSIVFGLFGMLCFNSIFGRSLMSGALTLSLMILPTIVRSTEESLLAVPDSLREASYALGAGKVRTIFRVVLPCAISGIAGAVVLAIGRIVGESAALIFTAGSGVLMPGGLFDSGSTFAVMMYTFSTEGMYMNQAYATAAVLLVIVTILYALVALIGKKQRKFA